MHKDVAGGPVVKINCGHPCGCKCELLVLEKVPCGYDTAALMKAAGRIRNGGWYRGAPSHIFAELLNQLAKDGFVLARTAPLQQEARDA